MTSGQVAVVFYHSASQGSDRLVMLAIADHDGEGGAWPGISTLARMANVSASTVRRSIKACVALGELAVHQQQGGTLATPNHRRPNRYDVLVRCPDWCDRSGRHACRHCRERGEHKAECPVSTGVSPVTPHGDDDGVSAVTPHPLSPVTPEPPMDTPTPTPTPPTLPESVARHWTGEGISEEHQHELWAALLADPATNVPARRAVQPAWYVGAHAALRARDKKSMGAAIEQVRRFGDPCAEHGTPGGAATHPETGESLCPLCRAKARRGDH